MNRGGIVIAVPLYRAPELLADLFSALIAMAVEIGDLRARLVLINDSPDDADLADALALGLPALRDAIDVELLENAENLGFVRTANRALVMGVACGSDIILLNSDARPRPGAFAEMAIVSKLDPMIAVVSPRSDNATICNSPYPSAWRAGPPDRSYANHRAIEGFLPRYTYVPTAVGFCIYVRHEMIVEFGGFDEVYETGYNEENDFVRRCNRRGYRAVLANHAYVHHLGGRSFASAPQSSAEREDRNRAILIERYPEYPLAVRRYFDGAEHRSQLLLAGLIPDAEGRHRILFDCRMLECSYKGTFEHLVSLLTPFVPLVAPDFDVFILCEPAAFAFHKLGAIPKLRCCTQADVHERPFAVAIRPLQPFALSDIVSLLDYAPVAGIMVLDTIAMDCQQLDTHGLDALWRSTVEAISFIGYNSDYTRDQFVRRIGIPDEVVQFVSRCSTDVLDYGSPNALAGASSNTMLIVGNGYPHKAIEETISAIRHIDPTVRLSVLGGNDAASDGESFASGRLSDDTVNRLYRDADLILFPSHYEGFGLPIMHGLALGKVVIARDRPSAREIRDRSPEAQANLYLGETTADIAALAASRPKWRQVCDSTGASPENWRDAAHSLLDGVTEAVDRFDYETLKRQQASIVGHRARLESNRRFHAQEAVVIETAARLELSQARLDAIQALHDAAVAKLDERDAAITVITAANDEIAASLADTSARWTLARDEAIALGNRVKELRDDNIRTKARVAHLDQELDDSDQLVEHFGRALDGLPVRLAPDDAKMMTKLKSLFSRFSGFSVRRSIERDYVAAFDAPLPNPRAGQLASLRLTPHGSNEDRDGTIERLVDWLTLLRVGGRFVVDLPAGFIDRLEPVADHDRAIENLIRIAGCAVTGIARRRFGYRVGAIKLTDSRDPLLQTSSDVTFIRLASRYWLRREPDRETISRIVGELASGRSRRAVARALATSAERHDRLSAIAGERAI